MQGFVRFIIKFRILIIVLTAILSLIFLFALRKIKVNPDMFSYLPRDDEAVRLLDYIGEEYGGNSLGIVVLQAEDVFNEQVIKDIDILTREFRNIDGISYVTSLTSVLDIKKTEEGFEIGKLINEDNLPDQNELNELKKYVLEKKFYRNHLVSQDARTTLIVCRISGDKSRTAREIERVVRKHNLQGKVYFAGLPFQLNTVNDFIVRDLKFLLPLVATFILLILYLSFRSFTSVILPLIGVGLSTLWMLGIMALLNIPLTVITNTIPAILIAVGSAYAIHVIYKFMEEGSNESFARVIVPVFLAALTTIIGFLSFIIGSYLIMIRQFGIFSAIGIFFAFLLSITLVPAIMAQINIKGKNKKRQNKDINRVMQGLGNWVIRNSRLTLIVGVVVFVVFLIGIPLIKTRVDFLDYFRSNTTIRITEGIMEKSFGGSVPIQILVKGDLHSPEVLNAMKEFHNFLDTLPGVNNPQSIVDLIEEMNDAMGEGLRIPDTKEKISNLYFLLEGEEMIEQMINTEKTEGLIQAMTPGAYTEESEIIIKKIQDYLSKINNHDYQFSFTGSPVIYQHLNKSLLRSQRLSLIIAIVSIFLCITLMVGSVQNGLIGVVPIVFILGVIFGIMGFFKIPLDVATVLVGSICIGIGIDYSIHFLNRYHQERKVNDIKTSILNTITHTGSAIFINVFTVMTGFLVLVFSNLVPIARFGILLAVTMFGTGLAANTLLPAILLIKEKRYEKISGSK